MEALNITRKEVAKAAGVSEATVSRVLNNVGPIAEKTRQKVLQAAKQLNYHPSAIAQRFARQKSGNIGVILPYVPKVHLFSTYYFSEILSGIGEAVKKHGYDLLLLFRSPEEQLNYEIYFQTQKIDACIILGAKDDVNERTALDKLKKADYPFCLVNQQFEDAEFHGIDADHIQGSYDVVKHLIAQGAQRIAFVNGPLHYSNSRDRLSGYKKALHEEGIKLDSSILFEGNYSHKSGYAFAKDIADISNLDAVFASNDRMAIGLMQGLKELGIIAGQQIALAGYDNSDTSKLIDPQVTTVDVPFFEMGKSAVHNVIEQLAGKAIHPCYIKLGTELIVRASSTVVDDK